MTNRKTLVGKTPQEKAAYAKMLRTPMSLDPTYEEEKVDKTNSVALTQPAAPVVPKRRPYVRRQKRESLSWVKDNWINLLICIVAGVICYFIINVNRDIGVIDVKINNTSTNITSIHQSINNLERDIVAVKTNVDLLVRKPVE